MCGDMIPGDINITKTSIETENNSIVIEFHSDGGKGGLGFKVNVTVLGKYLSHTYVTLTLDAYFSPNIDDPFIWENVLCSFLLYRCRRMLEQSMSH